MSVFRFKQFSVGQTGCAMKINTDGVLLAALAGSKKPLNIVDIGTGTGVIALMLAQRFPDAKIDAVEIDGNSATTALKNFETSPFAHRIRMYPGSFQDYFANKESAVDLIISNPPFFLNSLKNPVKEKQVARHTGISFFSEMLAASFSFLDTDGELALILPPGTGLKVMELAISTGLYLQSKIEVKPFPGHPANRYILTFGLNKKTFDTAEFIIYQHEKKYSDQFAQALKDFFIIF